MISLDHFYIYSNSEKSMLKEWMQLCKSYLNQVMFIDEKSKSYITNSRRTHSISVIGDTSLKIDFNTEIYGESIPFESVLSKNYYSRFDETCDYKIVFLLGIVIMMYTGIDYQRIQ